MSKPNQKSKPQPKALFIEWLHQQKVYDDFAKEIQHWHNVSVQEYLDAMPRGSVFPGYYIFDAFIWPQSITQDKKTAYDFWNSLHWRWKTHLNQNNIDGNTEDVVRDDPS